jgi:cysteinyl-tRNA synthetase
MRLHNTLTRSVGELETREPGRVGLYVCGPTVYDVPHFGHARAALVPDVLRRYLEYRGYEVLHVRNITDIEDKIINRAAEEGRHPAVVAEAYTRAYDQQMARLRILPPHVAPRATGHLLEMIGLIARLIDKGFAYEVDGDVWYAVRAFDGYGKLSGRDVDDLRSGARVEPDERKRDPLDFALWKAVKPPGHPAYSPTEPSWPSPWGAGRPGWHIECSAMAAAYLGEGFEIHAGGADLIFPHHENEIAQSEAATGATFARTWLHNGLLGLDGEKMSKSLGNVITLSDAIDRHGPDVIRFFFLAAHYRSDLDLSEERLVEAAAAVERWRAFERASRSVSSVAPDEGVPAAARQRFTAAMDDDLATPRAHAVLFDLVADGHQHLAAGRSAEAAGARAGLLELSGVLGYELAEPVAAGGDLVAALVEALLEQRQAARQRRDFAAADAIRDRLTAEGVVVEDTPSGPRWHLQ